MSSPAPLTLIFGFYLLLVLNLGPRYMRDRKPLKLNKFIRGYNIFQVIACTFFVEWSISREVNPITFRNAFKCSRDSLDQDSLMGLYKANWLSKELMESECWFNLRRNFQVFHYSSFSGAVRNCYLCATQKAEPSVRAASLSPHQHGGSALGVLEIQPK